VCGYECVCVVCLCAASIVVGLLGSYFHLEYGLLPSAPVGERVTIHLLVFAPPILGPMVFAIVGVLGISAAWLEEPANSGTLRLSRNWRIKLPYSKTQAYFYIVGMALLATLVSSTLDHARLNFGNPWLWVPIAVGVFGTAVTVTLGFIDKPTQRFYNLHGSNGIADYCRAGWSNTPYRI